MSDDTIGLMTVEVSAELIAKARDAAKSSFDDIPLDFECDDRDQVCRFLARRLASYAAREVKREREAVVAYLADKIDGDSPHDVALTQWIASIEAGAHRKDAP